MSFYFDLFYVRVSSAFYESVFNCAFALICKVKELQEHYNRYKTGNCELILCSFMSLFILEK